MSIRHTALSIDEVTEAAMAREDVAARLEGLARQVRRGTTTDVQALDDAYSKVMELVTSIKGILG
jgi:hypothetical protein